MIKNVFSAWGILLTIFSNQGTYLIGKIIQAYVINLAVLFYEQINLNLTIFDKNESNFREKKIV